MRARAHAREDDPCRSRCTELRVYYIRSRALACDGMCQQLVAAPESEVTAEEGDPPPDALVLDVVSARRSRKKPLQASST